MSEHLQVRIEFPKSESHGELLPQELSDSVKAIFLEAGIGDSAVSAGVEEVKLAGPLAIDPGTAAVLVALIGVSVELIKLGIESLKQDEELKIKRRELELKEQELEDQRSPKQVSNDRERELLQEFVEGVLLARLREKNDIYPAKVIWQIKER